MTRPLVQPGMHAVAVTDCGSTILPTVGSPISCESSAHVVAICGCEGGGEEL